MNGFCDSSEKANGTCLYLRFVNQQGEVTTKVLCFKSEAAQVKKVTLPMLEICGDLLLAQLNLQLVFTNELLGFINLRKLTCFILP